MTSNTRNLKFARFNAIRLRFLWYLRPLSFIIWALWCLLVVEPTSLGMCISRLVQYARGDCAPYKHTTCFRHLAALLQGQEQVCGSCRSFVGQYDRRESGSGQCGVRAGDERLKSIETADGLVPLRDGGSVDVIYEENPNASPERFRQSLNGINGSHVCDMRTAGAVDLNERGYQQASTRDSTDALRPDIVLELKDKSWSCESPVALPLKYKVPEDNSGATTTLETTSEVDFDIPNSVRKANRIRKPTIRGYANRIPNHDIYGNTSCKRKLKEHPARRFGKVHHRWLLVRLWEIGEEETIEIKDLCDEFNRTFPLYWRDTRSLRDYIRGPKDLRNLLGRFHHSLANANLLHISCATPLFCPRSASAGESLCER